MKTFTAIEIDYNRFKILEIHKKKHSYFLNNFVNEAIENLNYDDVNSVSINLKKIIAENKINIKNVFTSINGNSVESFSFNLPVMPESDLKPAVEYELKKVLPFPVSQCIFDYIYIETADESGNRALKITTFAVKEEYINKLKSIFDMSAIKIKSIECKTVSIYNNIRYLNKNKTGHLVLCDVGDKTVKIAIILNDAINFERTADGLNLKNMDDETAAGVIAEELKRTIDFYFAGKSLPPIDGIILTGLFSGAKGFDAKISDAVTLRAYSVSVLTLVKSEKYSFYLSKNLNKYNLKDNPEFFRPLEDMWTTFGLIINR